MKLPKLWRQRLKRFRRQCFEAAGSRVYSRPAINDIDRKLERHMGLRPGVFVEAGANDGFLQSNTYGLERFHGWRGLLIEPIPELARECRRNRKAPVANVALGTQEQEGKTLTIHFAGLMSAVEGSLKGSQDVQEHVAKGRRLQHISNGYSCEMPVRTLSSLLDQYLPNSPVDLLSLDVEGYEVQALGGLDFARHAPKWICVEARDQAGIEALLGSRYDLVEVLSTAPEYRDLLYRLRQ